MSLHGKSAWLWFAAALGSMVVSQIVRLQQSDPATWIFWDYAGRVGALALLAAVPSARISVFRWEPLRNKPLGSRFMDDQHRPHRPLLMRLDPADR